MWNSLARSPLATCLIHERWLCENPWMKRISGPLGLPQSCAEMVNPSGVFTETALNFLSCATADVEIAAMRKVAMEIPARLRRGNGWVMGLLRYLEKANVAWIERQRNPGLPYPRAKAAPRFRSRPAGYGATLA